MDLFGWIATPGGVFVIATLCISFAVCMAAEWYCSDLVMVLGIVGIGLAVVGLLVLLIFFPQYISEVCPKCNDTFQSGGYCTSCGFDLLDDCSCGREWLSGEMFCKECGKSRE